jgi:hypothetical protein
LKKNQDKFSWQNLSSNPSIFKLDYQEMAKQKTRILLQELMKKVLHPLRIQNIMDTYQMDFEEVMDLFMI